jgi:hypothetical protein
LRGGSFEGKAGVCKLPAVVKRERKKKEEGKKRLGWMALDWQ